MQYIYILHIHRNTIHILLYIHTHYILYFYLKMVEVRASLSREVYTHSVGPHRAHGQQVQERNLRRGFVCDGQLCACFSPQSVLQQYLLSAFGERTVYNRHTLA